MATTKKKALTRKKTKSVKSKTKTSLKTKLKGSVKAIKKAVKKTVKKTIATNKTKPKTKAKTQVKAKPKAKQKKLSFLPEGYHSITPYFIVENGNSAIEFYKKALGAKELMRLESPDGKLGHAELKISESKIMLSEPCSDMPSECTKGSAICIHLYVKNVDAVVEQAVSAGAKLIRPVDNMFYGDRCGTVQDPYGNIWTVATHVEKVSKAQLKKRLDEMYKKKH